MSSNINSVCVSGYLAKDPELKATTSGSSVLDCSIAVNESRKNAQGEWSDYANFFNFVIFGKQAEALSQYMHKGSKVTLQGKLRYSSWQDDQGKTRSAVNIIVNTVELPPRPKDDQGQTVAPQQPQTVPAPVPAPAAPSRLINVQTTAPAPAAAPVQSAGIYDQEIPF